MTAPTTKELADVANRARHNYRVRAVRIVDLLIVKRDQFGSAADNLNSLGLLCSAKLLDSVTRAVDEAAAAKADAITAEAAWLNSVVPAMDDVEEPTHA